MKSTGERSLSFWRQQKGEITGHWSLANARGGNTRVRSRELLIGSELCG